ncbi:MAG TPA: aspartate/glutamate racemase family protein [Caulobacteraceae bacterium]|nr:aspartate/glutamate racemase family protein [Caulobacteraceae bacterium]
MKTLGLLGGMSWESTAVYYRRLNELVRERLGGRHSARLLLWSADFAAIADLQAARAWDEAGGILAEAASGLEAAGAEAILICANTMHKLAGEVQAAVSAPLLHIADPLAAACKAAACARPLLLGTGFTMEDGFYQRALGERGVEASIPPPAERGRLHAIIFDELVCGVVSPAARSALLAIIEAAVRDGADAVILGCTELGLLVGPDDIGQPLLDTLDLHAKAAVDFALSG